MRDEGEKTVVGTIVSERAVFEHPFFTVIERVVMTPEGVTREPQLLWDRRGKNFVIVVATDEEGRYVLVAERKFGQMRQFISTPTGGIKRGETPLEAGKRELLAETGYESDSWSEPSVFPLIDFADKTDGGEHVILYATGARKVAEPRDPGQKLVLTDKHKLLTRIIPLGFMPAMSIAALLMPR